MRILLLFAIIGLSAVEFGKCDYSNSETVTETYVGAVEKSIQTLIKSEQAVKQRIVAIKDILRDLTPNILPKRNTTGKVRKRIGDFLNPLKSKIKAIFPGTYWCGDGNISPNEKDLGLFETTDVCCRQHDSCSDTILTEEKRDGLVNNGIFTRSSCDCDSEFYRCLKEASNIVAFNIGKTYFNILRPQCFQTYYPIQGCRKYTGRRFTHDKCDQYIYNVTLPEIMQWFDNPDF
ncbi:Phospholipase A2 [Habropoda laboriosa]|uniref:Phospholipase A2 n=1 Tax=Habropoda laboriosa TaxID=597456 RepID=A0A0L7RIR8_9HYME|nr:PREDICTED: phospholipase A2-like [Habropoda laboriosa]XP_017790690.1 PREDICTED: phospholipase A2-like [Habropoda laboriosa]KOC70729.1 Phospholipase A2 [Habropoda laboriosa]